MTYNSTGAPPTSDELFGQGASTNDMKISYTDYKHLIELLCAGDIKQLDAAEQMVDGFPQGVDDFVQRHWITNAIDCGTYEAVKWVLSKNVDLNFKEVDGYTPLLSAIDREQDDRHNILRLLISHGSPINMKGINDWTPLHMAAAQEDIEALGILVENGADLNIRTNIDNHATPLEEARCLGCKRSVEYLQGIL